MKEDYRSHGIGKALFSRLGKVAEERVRNNLPSIAMNIHTVFIKGCARMDWAVLTVSLTQISLRIDGG